MSTDQKVNGLNNLEQQCSAGISYIDNFSHDSRYYTKDIADSTFFRTSSHPLGRNDGHSSGLDAASVDGFTKAQLLAHAVPSGSIAIWALSAASIPAVWKLCDGTESSPDLRGRFLLGAGNGYNPGATGGGSSITPTASAFNPNAVALTTNQIPRHQHDYIDTYNNTRNWGSDSLIASNPPSSHATTTTGINGTPNTACVAHGHDDSTFEWTGYYDQAGVLQTGALPILPPSKAYCYILRR